MIVGKHHLSSPMGCMYCYVFQILHQLKRSHLQPDVGYKALAWTPKALKFWRSASHPWRVNFCKMFSIFLQELQMTMMSIAMTIQKNQNIVLTSWLNLIIWAPTLNSYQTHVDIRLRLPTDCIWTDYYGHYYVAPDLIKQQIWAVIKFTPHHVQAHFFSWDYLWCDVGVFTRHPCLLSHSLPASPSVIFFYDL